MRDILRILAAFALLAGLVFGLCACGRRAETERGCTLEVAGDFNCTVIVEIDAFADVARECPNP